MFVALVRSPCPESRSPRSTRLHGPHPRLSSQSPSPACQQSRQSSQPGYASISRKQLAAQSTFRKAMQHPRPPQVVRSYWPLVGAGGNHQALCSKLPGNSVSTSHPTSATRAARSSSALGFGGFVQLSQRVGKQAASTHSRRTAHLLDPGRSRSGAVSRG